MNSDTKVGIFIGILLLFAGVLGVALYIGCMTLGWGLEVKSWPWVLAPTIFTVFLQFLGLATKKT